MSRLFDMAYPYYQANYFRGRVLDQGAEKTKAAAVRESVKSARITHEVASELKDAQVSEIFFSYDVRSHRVLGGQATPGFVQRMFRMFSGYHLIALTPDGVERLTAFGHKFKTRARDDLDRYKHSLHYNGYLAVLAVSGSHHAPDSGQIIGGWVRNDVVSAHIGPPEPVISGVGL